MKNLVEFSRKYGSDPELVLAGGGNTSMKENGVLYVKGSGCSLSTIKEENFVAMDIEKLLEILKKDYPASDREREAMFLTDVSAAKLPGEEQKRPSVEALLHALFCQRYVLHLHPALVNGLTCGADGKRIAQELFPKAIWVDACRPGYTLAKLLSDRISPETDTVLLQNHGVFYASETRESSRKSWRMWIFPSPLRRTISFTAASGRSFRTRPTHGFSIGMHRKSTGMQRPSAVLFLLGRNWLILS